MHRRFLLRLATLAAFGLGLTASTVQGHPTVFPTGVTVNEDGVSPGHLIFRGQDGVIYLIDVDGTFVHSWQFPCAAGGAYKALDGGGILGKACDNIVEVDWDGNVVWEFPPSEGVTFHHDWSRLPNGNTVILARQTVNNSEVSDRPFRDDFLLEVSPRGEVVWEWHLFEHLDELDLPQVRLDRIREVGGDWSHANTVDPIPESSPHSDSRFRPGNLILSLRHQNTILIVDPVSNAIVWSMTDQTIGQHQTYMIPGDYPGGGNILVFDNGWAGDWSIIANQWRSRVVEIDPVNNTLPYVYVDTDSGLTRGSLFSFAISGAQRLPDGNTVITDGRWGRALEVTPDKQLVWEFINPIFNNAGSNNFYRTIKLSYDWAGPHMKPDLTLAGGATDDSAEAGGLLYTLAIGNAAAAPAAGVELVFEAPADATFGDVLAPADWNCTTRGTTLRCDGGYLPGGATTSLAVPVQVCGTPGETAVAGATVSSLGQELQPADNVLTIAAIVSEQTCGGAPFCGDGAVNGTPEFEELLTNGGLDDWSGDALDAWRLTLQGGTATRTVPGANGGDAALRFDRTVPDLLLRAYQERRGLVPGRAYVLRVKARAEGATNGTAPMVKLVNTTRREWLAADGTWQPDIVDVFRGGLPTADAWIELTRTFTTPATHAATDLYRVVLQHRGASAVLYDDAGVTMRIAEECDDGNTIDDDACTNDCRLNP